MHATRRVFQWTALSSQTLVILTLDACFRSRSWVDLLSINANRRSSVVHWCVINLEVEGERSLYLLADQSREIYLSWYCIPLERRSPDARDNPIVGTHSFISGGRFLLLQPYLVVITCNLSFWISTGDIRANDTYRVSKSPRRGIKMQRDSSTDDGTSQYRLVFQAHMPWCLSEVISS